MESRTSNNVKCYFIVSGDYFHACPLTGPNITAGGYCNSYCATDTRKSGGVQAHGIRMASENLGTYLY